MSGNICRCAAYPNIRAAIRQVRDGAGASDDAAARLRRAADVEEAIAAVARRPGSAFLAGGTTEVDLVRLGVDRPDLLVDINELPLAGIERPLRRRRAHRRAGADDRRRACTRWSSSAYPACPRRCCSAPPSSCATWRRSAETCCQRTRCAYFRDNVSPCNKREPGRGCSALEGLNRGHAILGTSEHCIATHPSDLAVALVGASTRSCTRWARTARARSPIDDFYLLPGDTPERRASARARRADHRDRAARAGDRARSLYLKFRDRQSYEFALVSVAAALDVRDGMVAGVRLALGGVATKPWRARRAEAGARRRARRRPSTFAPRRRRELERARARGTTRSRSSSAQRAIVPGADQGDERRSAMTPAIGQAVDRVDGPPEGHGRRALQRRDRAARARRTPRSSARRSRAAG